MPTGTRETMGEEKTACVLPLFHPDGVANIIRVLGSAQVPCLGMDQGNRQQPADVFLITPTTQECSQKGFLADAVDVASRGLALDGFIYAMIPAMWRGRVRRMLVSKGLAVERAMLHLPDTTASRYLIPLDETAAQGFDRVISDPRLRAAAVAGFRIPWVSRLATRLLPGVGILARRPMARGSFRWLFEECGPARPRTVVVRRTWRPGGSNMILHAWSGHNFQYRRVAKMVEEGSAELAEAETLQMMGGVASAAGVETPRILGLRQLGTRVAIVESELHGRTAASLLRFRPDRVAGVLGQLADWLERWNGVTVRREAMAPPKVLADAAADLELLRPVMGTLGGIADGVAQTLVTLRGVPLPVVACHQDLTMWNVLASSKGVGILDWEKARVDGAPMTDYIYAAVDAAAAVDAYSDRIKAFHNCFDARGEFYQLVLRLEARIARAVRITPEVMLMCRRLCWLHHAANEHRSGMNGRRPFLQMLEASFCRAEARSWVA